MLLYSSVDHFSLVDGVCSHTMLSLLYMRLQRLRAATTDCWDSRWHSWENSCRDWGREGGREGGEGQSEVGEGGRDRVREGREGGREGHVSFSEI